jgi:hypothetical protein
MRPQAIKVTLLFLGIISLSFATLLCQKQVASGNKMIAAQTLLPFPIKTSLTSADAPMPEILFFNVYWNGDEIVLTWDAANESELVGFQVERSENHCDFERIGWVYSRQISRNLFYEFVDENVEPGNHYEYRLRMVEFDGKMEFSPATQAIQVFAITQ